MGYLRPSQVEEIENEKRVLERTLQSRDVQDRGNINAHIRRIDEELAKKAPPDLTPEGRDQKVKECKMIEERLLPSMPSDEEMRRNPAGATGKHMRWERLAKSKDRFPEGEIFRWKDNQLALNKGDPDPDVSNFERLRPLHSAASMLGAQIAGQQFFNTNPSPAYLAGYDRTFGNEEEEVEEEEQETSAPLLDDSPELPELPDLPPAARKSEKKRPSRKKKSSGKRKVKLSPMPCGKMLGPTGRHFHVAKCEVCQEAQEG